MNGSMNEAMEQYLLEALDLLEEGASVEEILARFPAQATELRPFLLTAARLSTLARQPSMTAERASRQAFLAAGTAAPARPRRATRPLRLLAPLLGALAIVFLSGALLVQAAGPALPGSVLYEAKRFGESVRLALATDPERDAELRERFRQERVAEVERLLAGEQTAEVSVTGTLEAMTGEQWTVAGLPVVIGGPESDPPTVIDGTPVIGAWVRVDGRTTAGALLASRVVVLSAPPATPQPELAPPVDTPTPTASPTAAAIPESTPTPAATATAVPPSPTAAAPATEAPPAPPPPPATATPDDDDNDNDDDDGGDDDDNANDDNDNDGGGDGGGDDSGGDDANDNDDSGDDDAGNDDSGGDDSGGDDANDNDDSGDDDAGNDDSGGGDGDDDGGDDANDTDDDDDNNGGDDDGGD